MSTILEINDLSKSFGRKKILNGFNLSIEKGTAYCLLGKNGAGKTTLFRMIMGVIPPDAGDVLFRGNTLSYGDSRHKKEIGFIAEDSIYYGWMTVRRHLRFHAAFFPQWDAAKAEAYRRQLGLEDNLRIRNLSRGMKLKLGMITALAASPELLILDDPTSGLDVPTRRIFFRDILGGILDSGTSILFGTHMVHEIEDITQRTGILHQGRLVVQEEAADLKRTVMRVRFACDTPEAVNRELHGILTIQRRDRRYEIVIHPWNEQRRAELRVLKAYDVATEPLNLEEIFLSFIADDGTATVEGMEPCC